MADRRSGSGARDRLITVQQLTETLAPSRFPVSTWSDLSSVWAHKEDIGGRERVAQDQTSAPYDTKWTLPYSADWDPELVDVRKARRLLVQGRVHDIVAAAEVGRKAGVEVWTLSGGLAT